MSIYISQNPQFCIYLTIYSGTKLPPFYIGSTNIVKIKNGYHGSVKSKRYGKIWNQELKENPHLFKTIIIEKFYSRKNATYNERLLQIQFNVVKSDKFINMAIANHNGFFGVSCKGENNSFYGKHHTEKTKDEHSKRMTGRKNPEHSKRRKGIKNPEHSKKMSGSGSPNYGLKPSEETRKKISDALSGGNHYNATPVIINNVYYSCKKHACIELGLTLRQLNKLIN